MTRYSFLKRDFEMWQCLRHRCSPPGVYTRVRVDRSERRPLPRSSGIRNDFRIWAGRDANSYTSRALCCVVNARVSKQPLRFIMNARGCTSRGYFRTTSWRRVTQRLRRLTPVESARISGRYRDFSPRKRGMSLARKSGKRRTTTKTPRDVAYDDSRRRCARQLSYRDVDVGILYRVAGRTTSDAKFRGLSIRKVRTRLWLLPILSPHHARLLLIAKFSRRLGRARSRCIY